MCLPVLCMACCQVIDPYVKVEMHGVPADHKAVVTKHINDNGRRPYMHHMSSRHI